LDVLREGVEIIDPVHTILARPFCCCRAEHKSGRIRRVKYWRVTLAILASLFASIALYKDFKPVSGKEYKDATVTRELPNDVQQRFNYDPQKAAAYSAEQAANYAAGQNKQQEQLEESQPQKEVTGQNIAQAGQIEAPVNSINALQGSYAMVQNQIAAVAQRIREVKPGVAYYDRRGRWHHRENPERVELPALESQLRDLKREEKQVRQRLNDLQKAQH